MSEKAEARIRRSLQTRLKIRELRIARLAVHRTNQHMYAQIFSEDGARVVASASTNEKELRGSLPNGGNKNAATEVGKRIAERALKAGVERVAFDRGGLKFHGRVKALADAAREAGLKF